jgi:ribonuclease P protein component
MLPKKHRLPLRTDLVQVKEKGRLVQGRLFSLLVSQQAVSGRQPSRFAFIISTKVHKRAIKRNRARRLLIEAIRPLLTKIKPGHDVVFLAKKGIIDEELDKIARELRKLFRKAKLI